MTSFSLPRRAFLGYLAGAVPVATLSGCGGGGTGAADGEPAASAQPPSNVAPLVSFVDYGDGSSAPRLMPLDQELDALTLGPDRFGQAQKCHAFSSALSRALVRSLPPVAEGDCAISFWAATTTNASMRLLTLSGATSTRLVLDLDDSGNFVATIVDEQRVVAASTSAASSDGLWHHVLLQRVATRIELYLDGARCEGDWSQVATPPFTQLQVGGDGQRPLTASIDQVRLHDRTFSAAAVPSLVYAWAPVMPSNRADSVAAYYPFDNDAVNVTGKGFDGRLVNVVPTQNRFGDDAGAWHFNGVDSAIVLQDSFDASSGDFAITFWTRTTARSRMTALSIGGATDLALVFNDGHALRLVIDGGEDALGFGNTGDLADGLWHFVAFQRAGSQLQLFVDHAPKATSDRPLLVYGPGSVVRIGCGSPAFGQSPAWWSGDIDDLQLCECSFSTKEIAELEGLQFRPRDGAGALVFNDRMWLLGGWNPADAKATSNEVWSSQDGRHWTFAGNALWQPRHTAGWLVFAGRMWVIGGDKNLGHYQNDVWSTADGIHWDLVTDNVPWADRATHYVVAFDGRMWVIGGQKLFEPSGEAVAYNDVYSSVDGRIWTLESAHAPWSARGLILGSAVFREKMWVIGGGTYDSRSYNNDVWSSADGVAWECVTIHAPWSPRQYHSVVVFDDKLWVLAGSSEANPSGLDDVWYSVDGTTWTRLDVPAWPPRHATSAMAYHDGLWVAAGSASVVYNDVWRLGYAP